MRHKFWISTANILVGFFLIGSGYIIYDIVIVSKYKMLWLVSTFFAPTQINIQKMLRAFTSCAPTHFQDYVGWLKLSFWSCEGSWWIETKISLESKNKVIDWFTSNQVSVTMSIIGLFFPDILGLIGKMERFHPRIALRWLLDKSLHFFSHFTFRYKFKVFQNSDLTKTKGAFLFYIF